MLIHYDLIKMQCIDKRLYCYLIRITFSMLFFFYADSQASIAQPTCLVKKRKG